jgi:hypothetical protein
LAAGSRGRASNGTFPFAEGFPVGENAYQRISSIIHIPSFGKSGATPVWPISDLEKTDMLDLDDRKITNKKIRFAEWVIATLIPHPNKNFNWSTYSDNPLDCFLRMMQELHQGIFLMDANKNYRGPPGYEHVVIQNPENIVECDIGTDEYKKMQT